MWVRASGTTPYTRSQQRSGEALSLNSGFLIRALQFHRLAGSNRFLKSWRRSSGWAPGDNVLFLDLGSADHTGESMRETR